MQLATEAVAQKLSVTTGALIQEVKAGGAAAAAGLLATRRGLGGIVRGDVVLAVEGVKVVNGAALFTVLEEHGVGEEVELLLSRVTDQVRALVGFKGPGFYQGQYKNSFKT